MGYQLGTQCYSNQLEAENVYFSTVSPSIHYTIFKTDLIKPEFMGDHWELAGRTIHASFSPCDPLANFNDGMSLGWSILLVASVAFGFNLLRRVLR